MRGSSLIAWAAIIVLLLPLACKPVEKKAETSSFNEPLFFDLVKITDGISEKVKLMIMTYQDPETEVIRFSDWYLMSSWRNQKILSSDYAPIGMFTAVASSNSKYMAIAVAAEGHPWVEIISLDSLFASSTYHMVAELNPYPGGIEPVAWENNELLVWSDINLVNKNDSAQLVFDDMLDSARLFAYSLETKKFTRKK
ncbi:MAG TPA: hypothetical protein DCQ31_13015 [Bacteroidales bacterium]|nr:hypothetical protein [Bacteroidales bacterium]